MSYFKRSLVEPNPTPYHGTQQTYKPQTHLNSHYNGSPPSEIRNHLFIVGTGTKPTTAISRQTSSIQLSRLKPAVHSCDRPQGYIDTEPTTTISRQTSGQLSRLKPAVHFRDHSNT